MAQLTWPGKGTIDPEPAKLAQDSVVYPAGHGYPDARPAHRLILGDNLRVMAGLLPEYEGRFGLIYADPPFYTNRRYSARIGRGEDSRDPDSWELAEGYADSWPSLDAYLQFLHPRLVLMHRLLSPSGTLYLHLDWHANAYARLVLDEVFGSQRLINEIIWTYHGPSPIRRAFNRKHDTILAYSKGESYTFNADAIREPYHPSTIQTFRASRKAGFGKVPDLNRGKVPEDWWYFPVVARLHKERTGYPTQKPEALIERIIRASSNPGELVADFFCGSGTFPAAASRLGRNFVACDHLFRAIHTSRVRLCRSSHMPFSLERDEALPGPAKPALVPDFAIRSEAFELTSKDGLDYWEVDPAWDGEVFRSAAQAYRSVAGDDLPAQITMKTGRNPCVRFVTIAGEQAQAALHV
jgi:DNA modification methylase